MAETQCAARMLERLEMTLATRVQEKLSGKKNGIHSVEVAAEILLQLSYFRQPTSLKNLSERCQLSPSKVHRYFKFPQCYIYWVPHPAHLLYPDLLIRLPPDFVQ